MRRKKRHLNADLNITNLVDVVLTLLIIFMITAPMMTQGVQVDLPKAEAQNVEVSESIQISINGRSEVFIDQERIQLFDFKKRFNQVFRNRTTIPVFINADKKVPYGIVILIITEIQSVGAVKLGFLTQPLDKEKL